MPLFVAGAMLGTLVCLQFVLSVLAQLRGMLRLFSMPFVWHPQDLVKLQRAMVRTACTLDTPNSILHTPYSPFHTLHCGTPHSALYTPCSILCTLDSTLYVLHCTLLATLYTLRSALHTLLCRGRNIQECCNRVRGLDGLDYQRLAQHIFWHGSRDLFETGEF